MAQVAGSGALGSSWLDAKARLAAAPKRYFIKTHEYPEDDCPAIVIVRDPRAAIVSYWHFLREIEGQSIPLAAVAIGLCGYGDWNKFYSEWQPQSRPNTLLLRYEDIVADHARCIAEISAFTGLKPTGEWNSDFRRFHAINPVFFRAGDNKKNIAELSPGLEEWIIARCAPMMSKFGYQMPHTSPHIERWMTELQDYFSDQWMDSRRNLASKQTVIEGLIKTSEALTLEKRAWRFAGFLFWPLQRIILFLIKKKKALTKVRLGELHQHPPHYYSFYVGNLPKVPKPMPTISVVTPSYNQGRFLSQTIQSVLAQRYPALQYVVQDGASEDNSVEIIQKHTKALHAWASVSDRGQAHAINLGFEKTSGEIMAWLNGDDLHTPTTLAYVARYFQNNPHVDVVYGHRLIINEKNQKIGNWIMPKHDDEILSWVDYVPQETLFWRRKIWQKIGGALDESFDFALDWDLLLKFRNVGAKIVRLPVLLGCFRVHEGQKTSRELENRGKKEMEILRQRIHGKTITDLEIFNATKKYLRQSICCNLAWQIKSHRGKLFFWKKKPESKKFKCHPIFI